MKVVRTNEVPWADNLKRGAYANRRKDLGGERLNCGLWELAPGKKSFPLHAHQVTEEALFVISGRAQVRTPEGLTPIGPGDYVSFPAGGVAHQLINDGTEPLVYVGMSATQGVDVVEYPESGKVAAAVGRPGAYKRFLVRTKDQPDYFDGDKDAQE
ncbi:cupin domain-containing protein [Aggregicoccus sp. 17bor-14]|uniref:cupin domain-containing protein n=1 Tax=Myxococcaceae TaxID=31 RepID=UPI00129CC7C5|nr:MULTISPECIES: cupin domain-containing protein [Myxococcaceae]MBF5042947.1 cupin domain-containing protein [Simulacricoccus sp. 17bor-14]MRI88713.1 cupin domain-containing protein [Aggregicoccus sp. 17bor-14]